MSKSRVQSHAKKRACERYGVKLDRDLHRLIISKIQRGLSTPVKRTSRTRAVHDVDTPEGSFRVVYRSDKKDIITFLPIEDEPK